MYEGSCQRKIQQIIRARHTITEDAVDVLYIQRMDQVKFNYEPIPIILKQCVYHNVI